MTVFVLYTYFSSFEKRKIFKPPLHMQCVCVSGEKKKNDESFYRHNLSRFFNNKNNYLPSISKLVLLVVFKYSSNCNKKKCIIP